MADVDILITTEEDTNVVFGIKEKDYEAVAEKLAQTFGLKIVAMWQLRVTSTHFFIETSVDGVSWRVVQSGTLASGYLGASGYNHVFFGTMSYSQPGTSTLLSYSEGP